MYRKWSLFFGVLATLAFAAENLQWTNLPDGGSYTFSTDNYSLSTVATDLGQFQLLTLPGAGVSAGVGEPQVPVLRRLVEVPYGGTVSVVAEVQSATVLNLSAPLLPVQPSVPKSGPMPAFAFAADAYSADKSTNELGARVVEFVEVRGHRLAVVEILPVSYNPRRNELQVATQMTVRLRWEDADWATTRSMHQRYASPAFAGRLAGVVDGAERFASDAQMTLPIGYLIIVPDAWEPNIRPLAAWRTRRGFDVFVRTLTRVGGSSATVIKNYIQNAYNTWPVPPSFVLLVGDVDRIGYFTGQGQGNPNTDLNYALVQGTDYLPDIDVSRASLVSAAQVDSFVARVVAYEQRTLTGGTAWLMKQYFIASSDGGNHQVAERTHAYVMSKLRPLGIVCDSLWLYYGSGTPIVTAINGGRSWVTYSGHGSETSWADPDFDNNDVRALTNVDLIPYVQTYACVSGNYASTSYPECFSEAWIRNGRRGALAHIASSVNSYWTEDDTLERRVFDCMFDSAFTWIMGGFNKAKLIYFQQMGNTSMTRRYLEMYNLMGDGAVDVYSLEPRELTVAYPPVIPVGAHPLEVGVTAQGSPVRGALVCAMSVSDSTVRAVGYTNAAGIANLSLTTLRPDTVLITVTGHNLAPHLGSILALPSSGAYVMYLRHVVDDAAGNGDGIPNPGESINLPVWLKNWGSAAAVGVTARLRSADPRVTITDSVRQFGNIPAGDSSYSGALGFGFEIAGTCTNGYAVRFSLECRDANDSVWVSPVTLTVGAPRLEFVLVRADDPAPGGNGNGMIEPSEGGDLIVTLRNNGLGNAYGVTAVLRAGDARLTVLDSLGAFGDIPRETLGTNDGDRFRVLASAAIPRETQVPCTLLVTTGALVTRAVFMLDIGMIRTVDPIPDSPGVAPRYYAYDVTDIFYSEAPVFSWVNIAGVGTRLTLSDDQTQTVSLPTGFGPWRYYGQSFNQISICGNGWVAPGSTTASTYTNARLPDAASPGIVAVNWDDLYPPTSNGVWCYHDAANHRFVVQWDSMSYYSARSVFDWFQVIIYDTSVYTVTGDNVIVTQYLTANGYSSNTVGIENPQSTVGINCLFDQTYHRGAAPIGAGMAIKYTTNPPLPRTGLNDERVEVVTPVKLSLGESGPNPFRLSTTISYAVPRRMRVRLAVFDMAGRQVVELVDRVVEAGSHTVQWDGSNGQRQPVARGVYCYRLESADGTLSRKVVFAR